MHSSILKGDRHNTVLLASNYNVMHKMNTMHACDIAA